MDTLTLSVLGPLPFEPSRQRQTPLTFIFYYLGEAIDKGKIGDSHEIWTLKVKFSQSMPRIFIYEKKDEYLKVLQEWANSQCDHFGLSRTGLTAKPELFEFESNTELGSSAPGEDEFMMAQCNAMAILHALGEPLLEKYLANGRQSV